MCPLLHGVEVAIREGIAFLSISIAIGKHQKVFMTGRCVLGASDSTTSHTYMPPAATTVLCKLARFRHRCVNSLLPCSQTFGQFTIILTQLHAALQVDC